MKKKLYLCIEFQNNETMTIQEFNKLDPKLKKAIRAKAKECEVTLEKYLSSTDFNYCLVSEYAKEGKSKISYWESGGIYDYAVYGDRDEAENECKGDGFVHVITETEAIKMLNEYAKTHKK